MSPPQASAPFSFYAPRTGSHPSKSRFVFASGIECSYPVIETAAGRVRRDQMAECGHYGRWREDLDLALALGCRHLRYGPPLYRIHEGPGRYDWSFTDEVMPAMRELGITPGASKSQLFKARAKLRRLLAHLVDHLPAPSRAHVAPAS